MAKARVPAGMKQEQMLLVPIVETGDRPPVGLRVVEGGTRMLLCGPDLPKYLGKLKKFRPKFTTEYVQEHYDCLAETAQLSDVSLGAQHKVAEKLRKAGIPAQVETPTPQASGPIRWGAPNEWGVIRSELVAVRGGAAYYEISPGKEGVGIWFYYPGAGSGTPALTMQKRRSFASPNEPGPWVPKCSSVAQCKKLAERHLEISNAETGWGYVDWERNDGVLVPHGLIRWQGGRGRAPLPHSAFYDVMKFGSREDAAKGAKEVWDGLSGPTVAVKAKPVRVYEWDAITDDKLKAPGLSGIRLHGAWALSPDNGRSLLTRWAKNREVSR